MGDEKDNDQALKAYLQGEDGISTAYRQDSTEGPSSKTDEAILAASRKAVKAGPLKVVAPFSTRWHVPVSLAAVLLLSVVVVFNIPDETNQGMYEPVVESSGRILPQRSTIDRNESGLNVQLKQSAPPTFDDAEVESIEPSGSRDYQPEEISNTILQRRVSPESFMPEEEAREEMNQNQPLTAAPASEMIENSPDTSTEDSLYRARSAQSMEDTVSISAQGSAVFIADGDLGVEQDELLMNQCSMPRPEVCAEIYMPVCAVRDTGIRCVTTPCENTERIEYSNACSACSNENVISYTDGACATAADQVQE